MGHARERTSVEQLAGSAPAGWHVWASDAGHLYATGHGRSAFNPGGSVTVDAATEDGLRQAIAGAEREHEQMAAARRHGRR
jgi:hypothetical protein